MEALEQADEPGTRTTLSLRQLGGDVTWKVTASEGALVITPPAGQTITVEGEAIRRSVTVTHALTGKPLLSLRLQGLGFGGGRIVLVMAEADVKRFAAALGARAAATTAVSVHANWDMLIGALIAFTSVQSIVAPPADVEVSVPLELVRLGVGVIAIAAGAIGRLRPHRSLLLFDAVWMAALVADALHNVLFGEAGIAWVLLTAILVPVAWGRIRMYQLLTS